HTPVQTVTPPRRSSRSAPPPRSPLAFLQRLPLPSLLARSSSARLLFLVILLALISVNGSFIAAFLWTHQQHPALQGRLDPFSGSVDLSKEGTIDWAQWGYLAGDDTNPNRFVGNPVSIDCQYSFHCFNHKQGGTYQINDYT